MGVAGAVSTWGEEKRWGARLRRLCRGRGQRKHAALASVAPVGESARNSTFWPASACRERAQSPRDCLTSACQLPPATRASTFATGCVPLTLVWTHPCCSFTRSPERRRVELRALRKDTVERLFLHPLPSAVRRDAEVEDHDRLPPRASNSFAFAIMWSAVPVASGVESRVEPRTTWKPTISHCATYRSKIPPPASAWCPPLAPRGHVTSWSGASTAARIRHRRRPTVSPAAPAPRPRASSRCPREARPEDAAS